MRNQNFGEDSPEDKAIERQIKRDALDLSDPRSATVSPTPTYPRHPLAGKQCLQCGRALDDNGNCRGHLSMF
jgi:hypothetical protein